MTIKNEVIYEITLNSTINTLTRPVGMEPSLARFFHKIVNKENKPVLTNFLEPQQLALSVAGGAKLVHGVRMLAIMTT